MSKHVLVVDDNQFTANSFARLLSLLGHHATAAYSGGEALERVAEAVPDLVLLDIDMPGINGYETATRIRRDCPHPQPILVAVTAWARDEDQFNAYDAGFDLHVAKPVSLERLKELAAMLDPAEPRMTAAS